MKPITDTKEIHDILFGIMKAIRDFCDSHGLQYYLVGGTLLGAIRQQDFIPWDDDADIGMPREDMERFCREFRSPRYEVITAEKDPAYQYLYPKVIDTATFIEERGVRSKQQGLFVDIFPIDAVPHNDYYPSFNSRAWKVARHLLHQKNVPLRRCFRKASLFFGIPFRLIPNRSYIGFMSRIASRYRRRNTPFLGCLVGSYGLKDIFPRAVFETTVPIMFRNETFAAMSGWRQYLTALYEDDFMTPPPPEKQISHHSFRAWWKDVSETGVKNHA